MFQQKTDLHVSEVHSVEVAEHLVDLRGVLQDGSSRLSQMIQRGVTAQGLRKRTHYCSLHRRQNRVSINTKIPNPHIL